MQKLAGLVWFKIFPPHFGGQKGIAGFYQALAKQFDVDCWCSKDNQPLAANGLQVLPVLPIGKQQFLSPLVWLKNFQRLKSYDCVIIEFPYYALLGVLLKQKGVVYVLHTHNTEGGRFRQLKQRGWRLLAAYEKWGMQHADLVLFKTEEDMLFAVNQYKLPQRKAVVVPYGVTGEATPDKLKSRQFLEAKYGIEPNEKLLLFAGTLDYLPNAEAVAAIYEKVVPLLSRQSSFRFKILICGRNKSKTYAYLQNYRHNLVVQTGFVNEIEPYFAGADVFINPVQMTFGVQTKLADALRYNLNAVAFNGAQNGLPAYVNNQKLFLAEKGDFANFCEKIVAATESKAETPSRFYRDFNWDNIVANFVTKLEEIRAKNQVT